MKRVIVSAFSITTLFAFASSLQASSYTFTNLPFFANGINNAGQVVGFGVVGEGSIGVLYNQGVLSFFAPPGATDVSPYGINSQGQISGWYADSAGTINGFVDTGGAFTSFDAPGAPRSTYARVINDRGEIAGVANTSAGDVGFLNDRSTYVIISVPGARSTDAYGIDNAGDVVGTYTDASGTRHGFLYSSRGVFTSVDVPGSTDTFLYGINNSGVIVGSYIGAFSAAHGLLYNGGVFTTLDAPGGDTAVVAINDIGQLVVRQGVTSASLLATLVPEPAAFALFGAGLCGLLCVRRFSFGRGSKSAAATSQPCLL